MAPALPAAATSSRPTSTSARACWTASTCSPPTSSTWATYGSLRLMLNGAYQLKNTTTTDPGRRHLRLRGPVRADLPDGQPEAGGTPCAGQLGLHERPDVSPLTWRFLGGVEAGQQRFESVAVRIGTGRRGDLPREDAGGQLPRPGGSWERQQAPAGARRHQQPVRQGSADRLRPTSCRAARRTTTSSTMVLDARCSPRSP